METAHAFEIKHVLKSFPGSEPDGAERCSSGHRGDRVRRHLSSAAGCSPRSTARRGAGAGAGSEDDPGPPPGRSAACRVVPGHVLAVVFEICVTAYGSALLSTFHWRKQ